MYSIANQFSLDQNENQTHSNLLMDKDLKVINRELREILS